MSGSEILIVIASVFGFVLIVVLQFIIIFKLFFKKNNKKRICEKELINQILHRDSEFDVNLFKENIKQVLIDVYDALGKCDVDKLMTLESSGLYNMHLQQINNNFKNSNISTYFFENIGKIKIVAYDVEGALEKIGCKIWVTTTEVTIDYATKKAVSHDLSCTHCMYVEFIRNIHCNSKIKSCPNCGATIELNAQGRCAYCNSTIVNDEYSWVLNECEEFDFSK